jgi:CBS domain-containing protein
MTVDPGTAARAIRSIRVDSVAEVLAAKGTQVWSITADASVYEAIELMNEKRIGALVVTRKERLAGIISERDYARKVVLKGRTSRDTLVEDVMTTPVITVVPGHTVADCLNIMTTKRIRHLPVLHGEELAGVVSIGDLVRCLLAAQTELIEQLSGYISGKYPG